MMLSADFRNKAWQSLNGNWGTAIVTGFVASLLGARTAMSATINFNTGSDKSKESVENAFDFFLSSNLIVVLLAIVGIIAFVMLVYSLFVLLVGGPITLGYAKFNMSLVNGGRALLCAIFTLGIGFFWLRPYIEASNAVFYEEIKREKFVMSSGSEY